VSKLRNNHTEEKQEPTNRSYKINCRLRTIRDVKIRCQKKDWVCSTEFTNSYVTSARGNEPLEWLREDTLLYQ